MATAPASSGRDAPGVRYEYMFEKNKSPTRQLDALLRAMALYIKSSIGDENDSQLTPQKMAAFYKAVGGDYDSIFKDMPYESISVVWKITGCQHCLLPTDDDYAAPSVPALTLRGFSRWQSLEILLGPEEHVPYMQYAAKNWNLKDPDTGEPFPPNLPAEVFPAHSDPDVDRWHHSRAEQLRKDSKREEDPQSPTDDSPLPTYDAPLPNSKGRRYAFAHVRPREKRMEPEYASRQFAYVQAPPRATGGRGHGRSPDRARRESPPRPEGHRRKSFSEHRPRGTPPPEVIPDQYPAHHPPYLNSSAGRPASRRHSLQPEVTSESSEGEVIDLQPRRHRHASPTPPSSSRRFIPPSVPQPPSAVGVPPSFRSHRSDMTAELRKRRSGSSPTGSLRKITDAVTSILPIASKPPERERPRIEGRQVSHRNQEARTSRSREQVLPMRPSNDYSDFSGSDETTDPETSENEARHRRKLRNDPGYRDGAPRRGSDRSEREDDKEPDRRSRDRPPVRRQPVQGREKGGSHAESDRRKVRPEWDRERERDRMSYERDVRAKKWERERDRRASEDPGGSPITGVPIRGARYPDSGFT